MRSRKRRWIGVDGEGMGRAPHRYVMLASSENDVIEDRGGLGTKACLDFLLQFAGRDARVCGYYLSYDWTMILKDLPDFALYTLLRPELRARAQEVGGGFDRVKWKGYTLHYLAGAMWIRRGDKRVTVWDLGKYYQGPFVGALEDWGLADEVRPQIEAMKKRRAAFTWRDRNQVREYCLSECRALADLAECLERAHDDAEIKVRAWHGPGSTAGALLAHEQISQKLGPPLPPEVRKAAAIAYYGGRAEISCNGAIKRPVFEYDITSAYPFHATQLPCLVHARWGVTKREKDLKYGRAAIVFGAIDRVNSDWGPLPVRLDTGAIVYPIGGAAGYWYQDEWQVAREAFNGLRFDHAFVLHTDCDCRPFDFLRALFDRRLMVGKKTGEGRILKLALNSVYGKLAQKIGPAQYASSIWAGMITSGTRAQLLRHMLAHDRLDNVLMLATDGVYSGEPIDVEGAPHLGGWERVDHPDGMTLVRPGIYWTGNGVVRARGLGREALAVAREVFTEALASGVDRVELPPRTVFGGARLTVYATESGLRRSTRYGQWHKIPTRVSLAPHPKRTPDWSPPTLSGVVSHPYRLKKAARKGGFFGILEQLQAHTHDGDGNTL